MRLLIKGHSSRSLKMGQKHQKLAQQHHEAGRESEAEKHMKIARQHYSRVRPEYFMRVKFGIRAKRK